MSYNSIYMTTSGQTLIEKKILANYRLIRKLIRPKLPLITKNSINELASTYRVYKRILNSQQSPHEGLTI